jgi:hypothetical protein
MHHRDLSRFAVSATILLSAALSVTHGDEPPRFPVDPRSFGLDIPAGPVSAAAGENVATHDRQNQLVVGRLHVRVGEHCVVMLPDGELVGRHQDEVQSTERPFEAISQADLSERLLTDVLPGFKIFKTRHYLYIYNTSENFRLATSRILESMIPGVTNYARRQRIAIHDPEVPLVAIMFRREPEFQAYRRMPPGVVAYYHTLTNRIVMYEESSIGRVKPELAIKQAISTIAHEGAHQILHNIGVQKRLSVWPMWISEGLAEYFAPTTFARKLKWKGAGQVNDMRMFELELYLKSRESDQADGHLIDDTIKAARLTSTGYASAWSLTHFLAERRKEQFNTYVREVSQLGPLETAGDVVPPGVVPSNISLFEKHFGEDTGKLEQQLVKHLNSLPYTDPFAEWPHFVAMIIVPGKRRAERVANLFHTPDLAQKWITERLATATDEQRGAANSQIRAFPNRLLAEQYARRWAGGR